MRILFVAMSQSVHTARWLKQISDQAWDIHLFPSAGFGLHPDLEKVTVHGYFGWFHRQQRHRSVRLRGRWFLPRNHGLWFAQQQFPNWFNEAKRLAKIIRAVKPDILHSLEIQHAGYLTLAAKDHLRERLPPWIVTSWGSDTYCFSRLREHRTKIKAVLANCDFFDCECEREILLARRLGFTREVLPVTPNTGGFRLDRVRQFRQPGKTSARRLILLKGYQGWAGRALVGVRAIELSADVLKDYRVAIYLAHEDVEFAAKLVAADTGIQIDIIPMCSHEEMLRLHGQARVSIGLNISDGVSTSFLEALVMGSFPIQANTACADEWAEDGRSAILVHPEDPNAVARAIQRAVNDDDLVDSAAEINAQTARDRLDFSKIQQQVVSMYEDVFAASRSE